MSFSTTTDGITYGYNVSNDEATIVSSSLSNASVSDPVIPSTISHNGTDIPVVRIDDGAFMFKPFTGTLTLPSSLRSIGGSAFTVTGISSVSFPSSLEVLESSAFNGCTNLSSVAFEGTSVANGGNLLKIYNNAFKNTGVANYDDAYWSDPDPLPAWLSPLVNAAAPGASASGDPYITSFFP